MSEVLLSRKPLFANSSYYRNSTPPIHL